MSVSATTAYSEPLCQGWVCESSAEGFESLLIVMLSIVTRAQCIAHRNDPVLGYSDVVRVGLGLLRSVRSRSLYPHWPDAF